MRREQARQFREGEADVLVCTDAVGLGLNLPIKAMFFSTGTSTTARRRSRSRAIWSGRSPGGPGGSAWARPGEVGALNSETLSYVRRTLARRPDAVPIHFRYEANWIIVEALSRFLETDRLAEILFYFWRELALERSREFEPVVPPSQVGLAWRVDRYPLELRIKLTLSRAPVPMNRDEAVPEFEQFVAAIARKGAGAAGELSDAAGPPADARPRTRRAGGQAAHPVLLAALPAAHPVPAVEEAQAEQAV